jgi:uncharacterized repeat protein (TIGR01451 family)
MKTHVLTAKFFRIFMIVAMLLTQLSALTTQPAAALGETPAQTFFLSMPEDQVRTAFIAIDTGNGSIGSTMVSITSIAVTVNNTIIYYDQWEDGYEAASTTPVQASTLIFGDGNVANGNACTYAATLCSGDVLTAGAVLVLRNNVPSNPRGSATYFDAHDKVAVTQLVAVTRAMWDSATGTVLAGAIMVYDTTGYGTDFRLPAGENLATASSAMFDYAGLYIMAANNGTTVSIDADGNGTTDYTTTLNAGQAYLLQSSTTGVTLNSNAHITSNLPIQVNLITGDINDYNKYENRWFNIPPLSLLGPSYVTPVSSMSNSNSNVFIYNPSQTASITVYAQTSSGTTNFTVAAKSTYRYLMPTGSGARFYTTNAAPFMAIGTNDSPAVGGDGSGSVGSTWDWGYTLVAEDQLAPMLAVGWAPGSNAVPPANDGSPVWVSAAAATTIYVDYDGNPATGPFIDPNGNHYNLSYIVTALQSIRIYDPDNDQTGMRVYTVDGTLLTAAWGEDTSTAGTGNPYLDMGYVVFPLPQMSLTKTGVLDVTFTAPIDKANPGDKINYTIVATNTGTRILHNVTVVDAKLGTLTCTPAQPVASLAAGASVVCTGSYILTAADITAGVVYNTANGDSNETPVITVQEDVPIPLVSVTKTASPTSVPETGGNVTFTFTVTNNSPVETFKILSLTDSVYGTLAGDADCQVNTVLPVLSSCSFSITRAVTGDYPSSHTNTFTVVGADSKGNLMTASDPETVTITDVVPMIDVVKYVSVDGGATWLDANTAPGPFVQSGTNPQFKFVVTNTGSVALGSLTLSDPFFAAFYQADLTTPCAVPASLAPAASYTCYASSAWAAGQHTNTATATGSFTDSVGNVETGSDTDVAKYFGAVPALTLTKSATPGTYDTVGQSITYNYTIKNTGNVDLSGPFSVNDNKATVSCTQPADGALSPNEEMTCTATYTVTQADLDASKVTNTATATNGTVTSNQATVTVYAVAHPNLSLVKTATPATYDHVGQTVSYSYAVKNIGNVALSGPFAVADDKALDETCPQPASLAAGATITCTATYIITQADLDAGSVTNIATGSATFGGNPVASNQAQATVNATQSPALAIDKTAQETTYAKAGDVIHYSYLVTNAGNVTLHDPITVSDNKTTVTCPALTLVGLAPGESITCTATYTILQSDLDAGSLTNVASATDGTTTSPTDTVTVPAAQSPALTLVKHASPATYNQAGQTIAYTYDLTNNGNVTLSGPFTVTDDKATVTCPAEVTSLAVNDTLTCTASHTVTQAEVDSGSITNIAKGSAFFGTTPVDSNQDTKTVTAEKNPALTIVKMADPSTYDTLGQKIDYSYQVTNAGNVTLYNISVVDDKATVTCPSTSAGLAPNGTITCTASYTITQADLDGGFVTNSAYATDGTTSSTPDSETVTAIQKSGLGLSKSADPASYDSVGDSIIYSYVVQNTGNITLAGPFTVNDNKVGAVSCPAGSLAPGATVTCTATYLITQADLDAGSLTNTATATDGTLTSNVASATVAAIQTPVLAIDKTAQETVYAQVGDVIHYSYTVTNAGNVTLHDPITVSDDKAADESCPALPAEGLAPGASITCTASYIIQQADLDAGSLTNVASATDGKITSPTDTVTVPATQSPALALKKSANPLTYTTVDQTITYDYLLTNTGNVTLSSPFAVSDDKASVTCPAAVTSLAPGDTLNCTATYTITQADLDSGSVTNIATATAKFGETTVTSNQDTATVDAVQNPALSLVKSASPSTYAAVGQTISYSFVVKNTGNVTLNGPFSVADNKAVDESCPATASLAPGASITCTASYVVTQTDLDNGSVTNTATAHAMFGKTPVNSNEATATVNAVPAPALSLVKSALPVMYDHLGESIFYTYVLKNIGNVTLAGPFTVSDDKATVTCSAAATLAVGAELTCNATYLITQADLDNGFVTNIATGHGKTLGGTPVNSNDASATVNADKKPALRIVKTATPANYDAVNNVISYSYLVTNAGNVTLHDAIVVSDDKATDESCPALPAGGLAPGASITCTASYKITQADLDSGSVTNVASATSGTTVSPTDTETVIADKKPALDLAKQVTSAGPYDSVGDAITYALVATNTGNVTLHNVSINDPLLGALTCIQPVDLAPGAILTCTGSYAVQQGDLDFGKVDNTATADSDETGPDTASQTAPMTQSPALAIVKTATPATYSKVGDVISYSYAVTNSGNVTLYNITVVDDKAAVNCPDTSSAGLLPNGTIACTASYTIVAADITAGSVTNAAYATDGTTQSPPDSETVTFVNIPPDISVTKTAAPTSVLESGGNVTFTFVVTNNATEAATITSLSDSVFGLLAGDADCKVTTLLAAGASCSFQATFPILANTNLGSHSNTFTAVATDPEGFSDTASATAAVTYTDVPPTVTLDKSVDVEFLDEPGGDFTFTLTIVNTSWEEVTITTLTDSQSGDAVDFSTCAALIGTKLAAGASTSCTYVVTHTDVAPGGGSYDNTASVTVTDNDGSTATATGTQSVWVDDLRPTIKIEKFVTPTTLPEPGGDFHFTLKITNTSIEPVMITQLTDWNVPAMDLHKYLGTWLQPGEILTINYTVSHTDAMSYRNDASVTVQDNEENYATDTATQTVYVTDVLPTVMLVKSVDVSTMAEPGGVFNFLLTITNTSIESVQITDLLDDQCPEAAGYVGEWLDPGQVLTIECPVTHTAVGSYDNPASITVMDNELNEASASDSQTVTVTNVDPVIAVTKAASEKQVFSPGENVEFTVVVANNSVSTDPVTITSLVDSIHGNLNEQGTCAVPQTILPGSSYSCKFTALVNSDETDRVIASGVDNEKTPASAFAEATVEMINPSLTIVKTTNGDDGQFILVGTPLTWSYLVTNNGDVPLANITVTDDKLGAVCTISTLAAGVSTTCTKTGTAVAGQYNNLGAAAVSYTDLDGDVKPLLASDGSSYYGAAPALSLVKTATPATYSAVGQVIGYSYVVKNTGNVTLAGPVTVADDKATVTCPAGGLAPGAEMTCTASYTVTQADLDSGTVKNTAKASANGTDSNTDYETVTADKKPALSLVKTADPATYDEVGDVIGYSYVVKNTGNVTLAGPVTVTDDKATVTCPAGGLAPGASITCTASYTITQADLDSGSVKNTAKASANGTDSNTADATVTAIQSPALSLVKTATPATYDSVGDVISYSYLVKNTGNVTLAGPVTVTDDKATVICPAGGLAPGAEMTCTASYTIAQADLDSGSVKNTAKASANGTDSNTADATVTAVQSPALSLVKTATPAIYSAVGTTISYSYVVKNTGNVTLAGPVTVTDDKATVTCPAGSLAPLASMTCTASYTITQADLDGGSVKNTAKASANGTDSNTDDETVTADQKPALSLVKTATPATYDSVGNTISYSYLVKNTGNVTLAGPVTVTDDKATVTCPAGGLAPGAEMTCTASYTIAQADLDGGSVKNTAKASANGTDSNTADATVTAVQSPAISIVKKTNGADGLSILVGNSITWSYLVTNEGNVTLTNVTVTDNKLVDIDCNGGSNTLTDHIIASLAPAASVTCTATGTAVVGAYSNTGTASGKPPVGDNVTATDPSSYFGADPQIAIVKVTDGSDGLTIITGSTVTWQYTVTNVGNVPLSSITVTDNKAGVTPVYKSGDTNGDGILDLTETWIYEATGTAIVGSYSNIGTASGTYTDSEIHDRTDTATDSSSYTGKVQVNVNKTVNNKPFSGPELTFELRLGAAPVNGQFGTVLETQKANVANNGQVTFNTLLSIGTYQLCEYVPEGYVPSYTWGVYGVDWFKPGYAPGQGGLDPNILVCVNFTVNADGTIDYQNGQQIVQPLGKINIDNQVGQMPRTIGYWKNHASAKESGGKQEPVLDRMLYKATQADQTIQIGTLLLPGGSTPDNAGTSATYAVRLLNKSNINTNKKMASDPCFNLAAQLLGYRLNQPFGGWNNSVAAAAADYAQAMLFAEHFNGITHDKLSAKAIANLNYLASVLDSYNNDTLAITTLAIPYPGFYK